MRLVVIIAKKYYLLLTCLLARRIIIVKLNIFLEFKFFEFCFNGIAF